MRVALISSHSLIKPGGVKRHILGLKKEFKKKGIYSKIIAPRREKSENYGEDVILLGISFPLIIGGTQADFVINFNPLAIDRVLKKEKFDVLHFHNFTFASTWQILEKSKALNILTVHSDPEGSKFLSDSGLLSLWRKIIGLKIDGLIGIAPLCLKGFENFQCPKAVIPNGIDLDEFNPRVEKIKKFLDGKLNLLFVGRLEERKGLIYLLRAYKILEKTPLFQRGKGGVRLFVVGQGPLKKECEEYVKKNGLKEVHFEGEKTNSQLVSYYNSADIFVSPAIFGESFGIVLLEAMACQKPVVAFANQGYKEFLKGKKGGLLAKNRDVQDLAEKISILIKNPGIRKKMGERGLNEAKEYAWQNIADRVLDFYQLCQKEKNRKLEIRN
ncbi:glycosyltransferase family 4 protein [Patescibacteria group bacterium]|nr:glycosyltransferase family 4 protein [Patescibacteria group bacterium]